MIAKELIKGTIRTIVLRLLAENGKMYGYEIMQTIDKNTKGKIKLNFGIRKYYFLTNSGKVETKSKLSELKEFVDTLNGLMEGDLKWEF